MDTWFCVRERKRERERVHAFVCRKKTVCWYGWVSEWGKLVYVGLRRLMIPIYLGILASYFLAHAISLSLSLSTNKRSIPVICPLCLTFFAFSIVQFTQYVGVYYTYPSSSALSLSFCLLHYLSSHSSFLYLCVFHFTQ